MISRQIIREVFAEMFCGVISLVTVLLILQIKTMAQDALPLPLPTPVADKPADRILKEAYRDTFAVLQKSNTCSDFFGGPAAAVTVLNELFSNLRKDKLPGSVSFTMTGKTLYVKNIRTNVYFRVFEKTLLNENGSFYRRRTGSPETRIPNVGSFSPATREARALTLLHEMGHLTRAPSGGWLIPDDGNDSEMSRSNTQRIQRICITELKTLSRN
jgi:hypothetical protein